MIFRLIKPILYGYEINSEQLVLLDLLNDSEEELNLYLTNFPEDKKKLLQNLIRRGFIKESEDSYILDFKGEEVIKSLDELNVEYCKSTLHENIIKEDVELWIEEFRDVFNGLKLASMGSKTSCIKKMRKFVNKNPSITKEDIIQATKYYIDSMKGDYRYLQQADYFIEKHDGSRLETWLEEIKKNPHPLGDWTTTLS